MLTKNTLEKMACDYRDRYHTSWKAAVGAVVASFPDSAKATGFGAWLCNPANRQVRS